MNSLIVFVLNKELTTLVKGAFILTFFFIDMNSLINWFCPEQGTEVEKLHLEMNLNQNWFEKCGTSFLIFLCGRNTPLVVLDFGKQGLFLSVHWRWNRVWCEELDNL